MAKILTPTTIFTGNFLVKVNTRQIHQITLPKLDPRKNLLHWGRFKIGYNVWEVLREIFYNIMYNVHCKENLENLCISSQKHFFYTSCETQNWFPKNTHIFMWVLAQELSNTTIRELRFSVAFVFLVKWWMKHLR